MKKLNKTLLPLALAFAWAVSASAELTLSWTGERQNAARASAAGAAEASAGEEEAKEASAAEPEENDALTREEYLATVAWAEGDIAVDELSRRMVDDLLGPSDDEEETRYGESASPGGGRDVAIPGGAKAVAAGVSGTVGKNAFYASDSAESAGKFSASDSGANYAGVRDWMDKNGGEGFGAWQDKLSSGASVDRTMDSGSLKMQATAPGEIAMVRPLDTAQGLESGTFSVTMWGAMGGADEIVDFAGFALYGSGDKELFRWGFRQDGDSEGLAVSLDGGANYTTVSSFYPLNGVDYVVTWALIGDTTQFTLSAILAGDAEKEESDWTYYYNGSQDEDHMPLSLGTSERVMAIAAILTESGTAMSGGDGSEMTFDNMRVTGNEPAPAVPEPGVTGLLAAGLAALWGRRTKRKK